MADRIKYDTQGADLDGANPETGYSKMPPEEFSLNKRVYPNGDTSYGDPFAEQQGFLTRPHGWER